MTRFFKRVFSAGQIVAVVATLVVTGLADPSAAQDEKELGWSFAAALSAVWVGGNSESNTFGATGGVGYTWTRSQFQLLGGGTRTESTIKTRTAVGSSADFVVNETEVTEKTAEFYFATAKYDYQVHERFLVFGGLDWLRNTFSGIDSRFLIAAGAGNTWWDNNRTRFITDYSFTYTFQEDVVKNPLTESDFPGVRLGIEYWRQVSESTEFKTVFTGDLNLDNTDDVRIDTKFELPVSVSDQLALQPALRLLWRNDPSLTEVPLFTQAGDDTGETVAVPLEELDTIFTLALVLEI